MDGIGAKVREAREARRWSQERLAEAVGTTQSTIDRLESGQTNRPRCLPEVLAVLGLAAPWRERPQPTEPAADLPVYGTVEGGAGAIIISHDVVDTFPRPTHLASVPDAYALYVVGDSMAPVYRPGDLIIIHPHLPPRRDDAVVLYSDDRERAQIKEFVKATDAAWRLKRYQPEEAEFNLPRKDWPRCHLVIGRFTRR